jgi:hypothetical protein
MSTVPVGIITVATNQNVAVARMMYPLIAIVFFCSSVINVSSIIIFKINVCLLSRLQNLRSLHCSACHTTMVLISEC